jgi:hypothetical protein
MNTNVYCDNSIFPKKSKIEPERLDKVKRYLR